MHAWFQCASGASGDMLLGALLDAGASLAVVRSAVAAVGVEPVTIEVEAVRRAGLAATHAVVRVPRGDGGAVEHRSWADVRALLEEAGPGLAEPVRARALAVFARLAAAEGRAHGIAADDVTFHEVGALDSIADVVGVCAALHDLGVTACSADAVAVGSGSVRTAHGVLPVPVPAVVELLSEVGAPLTSGPSARELCTPTGAALLAELVGAVGAWGPVRPLRLTASGVGAGSADLAEAPNVLRVLIGEPTGAGAPSGGPTPMVLLETNVDDLDPRLWPGVLDRLLEVGAADAWLTPILMKKGRPAHTLHVLADPALAPAARAVVFGETTAIGLRETPTSRHALARTEDVVQVRGHPVRVKLAWPGAPDDGEPVNTQLEHDDLVATSAATGVPVKLLLAEAFAATPSTHVVGVPD